MRTKKSNAFHVFIYNSLASSSYRVKLGEPPLVQVAANTFKEICYNYRDMLMAGIIVAGWDKSKGGQVNIKFFVLYLLIVSYMKETALDIGEITFFSFIFRCTQFLLGV